MGQFSIEKAAQAKLSWGTKLLAEEDDTYFTKRMWDENEGITHPSANSNNRKIWEYY